MREPIESAHGDRSITDAWARNWIWKDGMSGCVQRDLDHQYQRLQDLYLLSKNLSLIAPHVDGLVALVKRSLSAESLEKCSPVVLT